MSEELKREKSKVAEFENGAKGWDLIK